VTAPARPDALIQSRVRLGVLAYLASRRSAPFTELAAALETSAAVLSAQLKRLEETGEVRLERGFFGRKPRTTVIIAAAGRAAYQAHLDELMRRAATARAPASPDCA
jgi:DNA-binding MarR family transcriptional regulator